AEARSDIQNGRTYAQAPTHHRQQRHRASGKQTRRPKRLVARTDAGSQSAHAGDRRARPQDGADHLGTTCKAGKLQSSGRSRGVSLADLRSSQAQSVEGGYGTTVGETEPEEPDVLIVPGARFYDLVPVRELPYGRAAPSLHQRPDRWQHPTMCQSSSKTACTWWGVHR